jgi:hypothetical protein
MPSITCPYCQMVNSSKFQHKLHLRVEHAQHFEKNLKTSITGATSELVLESLKSCLVNDVVSFKRLGPNVMLLCQTSLGLMNITLPDRFGFVPNTSVLLCDLTALPDNSEATPVNAPDENHFRTVVMHDNKQAMDIAFPDVNLSPLSSTSSSSSTETFGDFSPNLTDDS